MNVKLLGLLVGSVLSILAAAQPLHVAGVVRTGPPPFEEGERLYRLEGDGCQTLMVAESLTLRREGEKRNLGRLRVAAVKDGYALARLDSSGETYPLKGDLAVRHERALALPGFPAPQVASTVSPEALVPARPSLAVPPDPSRFGRRETLYFLKGSGELSAAGLARLRAWVGDWGPGGRWILLVPARAPEALTRARVEALKGALRGLGVTEVEQQSLPSGPPARYDSISVSKESW